MFYQDIDDDTLHLVIQMQLEDLENLTTSSKGKQKEGERPDADIAIEAYKAELVGRAQFASDRSMSRSMQTATRLDGRIITAHKSVENQATDDRKVAIQLSEQKEFQKYGQSATSLVPRDKIQTQDNEIVDDDLLRRLNALYVSADPDDDILDQPESSTWAASRGEVNGQTQLEKMGKKDCNSCLSKYYVRGLAYCPCGHRYCGDCLRSLFEASLTDESLFPPRCCSQSIPVDDVRPFLTPKFIGEFLAKELELSTPNRTYCHRPQCSAFVPPQFIKGDVATCPRCSHKTCTICKGAEHLNQDCAQDTATQSLLQVAAENGWQRCYACRAVVELGIGCNHMTCRCGAQFCYTCGLKWHTCTCELWTEDRLYARANVIADRNAHAGRLDAQRRAVVVEREAQNLVRNHRCVHATWVFRSGSFRCEECHDILPQYIYECGRCRILACHRCRYNRLRVATQEN